MAWKWKVEIDIEALETESKKLAGQIKRLNDYNNRLNNLINNMSSVWEGDAAIAYINAMRKHYNKAVAIKDTLNELKKSVDIQVTQLREIDNWFEKVWYQLFTW